MRDTEFEIIPTDTAQLVDQMVSTYEELSGETLMPASPESLMIHWVASILHALQVLSNWAANQNIPSRAEGVNLDALAELYYAQERAAAKPAVCTMRFHISAAQLSSVLIPAGTRVTDGAQNLYWETVSDAWVPIGDTSVDAPVRCQTAGTVGNGWVAGSINTIVDVFDYYSGCESVTISGGGADVPTDDEFYALLKASMSAFSTAGPRGAYEYHARSVSAEIADVKAVRPRSNRTIECPLYTLSGDKYAFLGGDEIVINTLKVFPHGSTTAASPETDYTATYVDGLLTVKLTTGGALENETQLDIQAETTGAGRVVIYVLMDDGSIAGEEVKSAVLAACSDDSVRPLSDLVTVADPETVGYNIDLTYYIPANATSSAAAIQAAVEAAVEQYIIWQSAKLGRDINPSYLIGLLMQTGIKRVVVRSPAFTPLHDGDHDGDDEYVPQVATVGTTTIVSGGVENE